MIKKCDGKRKEDEYEAIKKKNGYLETPYEHYSRIYILGYNID